MKEKSKIHYGWFVTAGCCLIIFYSYGLSINVISIFIQPLIDELQISHASGSSILSTLNISGMVMMGLSGRLYNRFSTRKISLFFGLLIALGFMVFSYAKTIFWCYIAGLLIGLGWGGGSMIPVSLLINRWFHSYHGIALGIATAGSGIATMIYPPVAVYIIETYDLSVALKFHSICIVLLVVVAHMLVRNNPDEKKLSPYQKDSSEQKESVDNVKIEKISEHELLFNEEKKSRLYMSSLIAFLIGLSVTPVIAHFSVFYVSFDYSLSYTGFMVSVFGVFMIVGKILYGMVIDRTSMFLSNIYIHFLWTIGLLSFFILHLKGPSPIFFAVLTGIGSPIATVGIPTWTRYLYGYKDYASFFSLFMFFYNLGSFIGMYFPGIAMDSLGKYDLSFIIYASATLIAFLILHKQIQAKEHHTR